MVRSGSGAGAGTGTGAGAGAGAGAGIPAFGGLGGAGGLGGLPPSLFPSAPLSPAATAASTIDMRPPEERYAEQLRQLNEMGFFDFDRNIEALRRSGGNVNGAVGYLLES